MPFRKYLKEDSLFLDKELSDWEEALGFLSEQFEKLTTLSREEVLDLLQQREEIGSTWIGAETVMPHNHTQKVEGIHIILIRTSRPLLLPDGNEIRYIISLLTSGNEGNTYLSILQEIARLMKDESDRLNNCTDGAELLRLIGETCQITGLPLKAADLAEEWPLLYAEDTVGKALDLMKRHGVYFMPVLTEEKGRLCGVLDLVDLLKAGFPDYVFSLSDLSLIQDFKPVKFFWSREGELPVREFLRDYRPYIVRSDANYPEIFFLMIKGNRRHLLVMNREENLQGVIHPNQIIDKMLRP
ncbi:MAG: PTS sugar transporter subunit IIA [Spirochaetales bacterium]|nr:PTS sugar transporter subunit IIA [Spirochaetales bacterium]